ncbi:hypothetical protein EON65_36710 [archaeon]|nr:MAG: hypothetical protein EON65_36710 [archaeon]
MAVTNPWYTSHPPDLQRGAYQNFLLDTPLHLLGGEYTQFNTSASQKGNLCCYIILWQCSEGMCVSVSS